MPTRCAPTGEAQRQQRNVNATGDVAGLQK
jgi:hypothetical protein